MAKERISVSILPKNWGVGVGVGSGNKNRRKEKKTATFPNHNLWKFVAETYIQLRKHSKSRHRDSQVPPMAEFTELIMTAIKMMAVLNTGKYGAPTVLGTGPSKCVLIPSILMTTLEGRYHYRYWWWYYYYSHFTNKKWKYREVSFLRSQN